MDLGSYSFTCIFGTLVCVRTYVVRIIQYVVRTYVRTYVGVTDLWYFPLITTKTTLATKATADTGADKWVSLWKVGRRQWKDIHLANQQWREQYYCRGYTSVQCRNHALYY